MIGEPIIRPSPYGDKMFYELEWGTYRNLVKSLDEKKVKKALPLISHLVETSRFKEDVKSLMSGEDMVYTIKLEKFKRKIKDLVKSIELGNVLKGKCRYCR